MTRSLRSCQTLAIGACVTVAGAFGGGAAAGERSVESATQLRGTVSHAPARGIALFVGEAREQDATADADGQFSFSIALREPAYAELEFEFRKGRDKRLGVFLAPGKSLVLQCDAADTLGTVRFSGGAGPENELFAALQRRYARIDYDALFRTGPDEFLRDLRQHQEALAKDLADGSRLQPRLDEGFLRYERARITYLGPLLRVMRLGLSGDWEAYAAGLDFDDPTLLPIDTYARFLKLYTKVRARERASDATLALSVNQLTDARYAVATETYKDRKVRNVQLHAILENQFVEGDDGPFGCKGLDATMARFDRDCTDPILRGDIARRYRECLANRNAPVIRPYKTVGATSLDAHVFPAAGAAAGERRPAFLFFHGGGWAAGMPEWGYAACRRMAGQGFVGISFEYRLRWRHGTTPIESVAGAKSAVRWVRTHAAELGVDPERIVVAGFSAGSHLAASTGMVSGHDEPGEDTSVSAAPAAMILISAAIDVGGPGPGWFNECLAGRATEAGALSPLEQVRSGLPPTIVFHGVADELGAFSRVEEFCQKLRAAGNRCDLVSFAGGHFRSAAEWRQIDEKTDAFLASLGLLGNRASKVGSSGVGE